MTIETNLSNVTHMVTIKRIYEQAEKSDGKRILVDRLWPRGVKKEDAELDDWNKALAPSPELRQWFDHKPERFNEFSRRYTDELASNSAALNLRNYGQKQTVTLLYAAKDEQHNHALILQKFLTD